MRAIILDGGRVKRRLGREHCHLLARRGLCLRITLATLILGVDDTSKVPLCVMVLISVHRRVLEPTKTALDIRFELLNVRLPKETRGLEAVFFLLGKVSTLLLHAVIFWIGG